MKSVMKVRPVVALNPKRVWSVSPSLTCVSRAFEQPWEEDFGKPERIVTALDIA